MKQEQAVPTWREIGIVFGCWFLWMAAAMWAATVGWISSNDAYILTIMWIPLRLLYIEIKGD